MHFLNGPAILSELERSCVSAKERVVLVSAYVKEEAFTKIASKVSVEGSQAKVLVTRWRLDDLVSGASDLAVYSLAKEHGWQLLVESSLHSKVYIVDQHMMIGSANLTLSGMQLRGSSSNIESMLMCQVSPEAERWCQGLLSTCVPIDDLLFEKICYDVQSQPKVPRPSGVYSHDVLNAFSLRHSALTFYTEDMLWSTSPLVIQSCTSNKDCAPDLAHDLQLLGCNLPTDIYQVRSAFERTLAWQWLKANASNPVYFGELSSRLHNALQDDPKVFRKTAKGLLINLLNWAEELEADRVTIDTPNFSQRILIAS